MSNTQKERLKKNGHPNKGRKWSKEIRKRMSDAHKGRVVSDKQRRDHSKCMSGDGNPMYGMAGENSPAAKKFLITTPSGERSIVKGLSKFCRDNNLGQSSMYACAKGRQKQHKGFKCKYYNTNEVSSGT